MYSNCCGGDYSCSNVARTGAGCAMMSFCGIPVTDSKFQKAISYLDTHWTDDHGCMPNWDYHFSAEDNYYAFYGIMKGMRLPAPDIKWIGAHKWYEEYADFISNYRDKHGFNLSFKSRNFWEHHLGM